MATTTTTEKNLTDYEAACRKNAAARLERMALTLHRIGDQVDSDIAWELAGEVDGEDSKSLLTKAIYSGADLANENDLWGAEMTLRTLATAIAT